jgi:hypothetical protein
VQQRLIGALQEAIASEQDADGDPGAAADEDRQRDLASGDAEIGIEGRLDQEMGERPHDEQQRRHDIAIEQPRARVTSQIAKSARMMPTRVSRTARAWLIFAGRLCVRPRLVVVIASSLQLDEAVDGQAHLRGGIWISSLS